jgi:hypothetical protein
LRPPSQATAAIIDWFGWRGMFAATALISAIALSLAVVLGNHDRPPTERAITPGPPDFIGIGVGTVSVELAALAIVEGNGGLDVTIGRPRATGLLRTRSGSSPTTIGFLACRQPDTAEDAIRAR